MAFKVGVGKSSFEDIRESGNYYVDKTDIIYKLVEETDNEVTLFTRPRRFGKTLMMSMMSSFFSIEKDSRGIFDGLDIMEHKEFCGKWMNQHPVLFISFKDIEGENFDNAYEMLKARLSDICIENTALKSDSRVNENDVNTFARLEAQRGSQSDAKNSLKTIMRMMHRVYGKKVILLIDEYDVPLAGAGEKDSGDNKYYSSMLEVIRGIMGTALKDNEFLEFAVVTGCLRIAKESIFTGTNKFTSYSVLDEDFSEYFGFTEGEVDRMLSAAEADGIFSQDKSDDMSSTAGADGIFSQDKSDGMSSTARADVISSMTKSNDMPSTDGSAKMLHPARDGRMSSAAVRRKKKKIIKEWYDGYVFGDSHVYCPWDVMNYMSALKRRKDAKPKNYWKNTSHNSILLTFAKRTDFKVKGKFETLLNGGSIVQTISDELTYDSLHDSEDSLWSSILMTGYLTKADAGEEGETVSLKIPNREIASIFEDTVVRLFRDTIDNSAQKSMMEALWGGNEEKASEIISDLLWKTISYNDYHEDYYHAFLAGVFVGLGYEVESNREKGLGRPDILLKDEDSRRAIIIEAKKSKKETDMEKDCSEAVSQIAAKKYVEGLYGYTQVLCYGIAFFQKQAKVKQLQP